MSAGCGRTSLAGSGIIVVRLSKVIIPSSVEKDITAYGFTMLVWLI
jgi:hypothetical protein